MNKKIFWNLLTFMMVAMVSVCFVSCGGDDEDESSIPNDDNSSTITTNYTVTNSVKTVKLGETSPIFYEDYNKKYEMYLYEGYITIRHYVRYRGDWEWYGSNIYDMCYDFGIKDVGVINGISDISSKDVAESEGTYVYSEGRLTHVSYALARGAVFQPKHGYSVMFKTEDGEQKYMRVYALDYTDNNGLNTVTVQYQQY